MRSHLNRTSFSLVLLLMTMVSPGCAELGDPPPRQWSYDLSDSGVELDAERDLPADTGQDLSLDQDLPPEDQGDDLVLDVDLIEDQGAELPDQSDLNDLPDEVEDWVPECTSEPCPIVIEGFPYHDQGSTLGASEDLNAYSCAPGTDEGGPEQTYVLRVEEAGTLVVGVYDEEGVDIDIHLLGDLRSSSCLQRGDTALSAHLAPGVYYLAADSWVNGSGLALPGSYQLHAWFVADQGPCAMNKKMLDRIGDDGPLSMPASGKVVQEAHLVTEEEFESSWPSSIDEEIDYHYHISERASGYEMARTQPWAPCCEPSNEFGQGSTAKPPAIAEAWYINMRWANAPARGERYLVFNPETGQAVVAAAGYENGPGDLSRIGGACEEIHHYLGTSHLGVLTFGQMQDQSLDYGPISCF